MVVCPDCHSDFSLPGYVCDTCGFRAEHVDGLPVLLSSEDRASDLFGRYVANYDVIAEDDLNASIQSERYLDIQTRSLFRHLGPVVDRSVCELGVGQGRLLRLLLKAQARQVTGVDISVAYLRQLVREPSEQPARLVVANAENLPFRDEFEVLVASDVLEHVLNVGDFLISVKRALARDGLFVVRVPYQEDLRQYARQEGCEYPFVHLRTFSRTSLTSLLRQTGFRVERVWFDGVWSYQRRGWTQWQGIGRVVTKVIERTFQDGLPRQPLPSWVVYALFPPSEITVAARPDPG